MVRILLRRSLLTRLVMPELEGRYSRSCAGSTAPITSRSLSFPMSSTGRPATTMGMSVHIGRAAFPIYHRPRKKTARAGFISAFIGPLIRPKASPQVAWWAITYSITLSDRPILSLKVGVQLQCAYELSGCLTLAVAVVNLRFRSSDVSVDYRPEF